MATIMSPIQNQAASLDRATLANQPGVTTGASTNSAARGPLLVSAAQSLANAAEELTFAFSERTEKSLAKRKVSDGQARVNDVEALVQEYLDKVPDLEKQQKLQDLVSNLGQGNVANMAQLQAYLKGFSGEPSHQFMALSYAREQLQQRGDSPALVSLIEQALLDMAEENGDAIELGIRVSPIANEAEQQGVGDLQGLRNIYRDAVLDYSGLSAAFRDIQQRFGSSELEGVTGFMMKALSADLESQGSRLDPTKLKLVMTDMHKLRLLNSLQAQVTDLWQTVVTGEKGHGIRAF